jgi:hypothetical protein
MEDDRGVRADAPVLPPRRKARLMSGGTEAGSFSLLGQIAGEADADQPCGDHHATPVDVSFSSRTVFDESWGRTPGGRHCGGCTLCCKLLPVPQLKKLAGERCRHQRTGKGCAIYHSNMPSSCHYWNCRWLANLDTADLSRPDRVHYVIDVMPDHIDLENKKTGERIPVEIIQIWVDPDFPDAHRDPALRAYLERQRKPALIRYDNKKAFALFPPSCAEDGQWHEQGGTCSGRQHDVLETQRVLVEARKNSLPGQSASEHQCAVAGEAGADQATFDTQAIHVGAGSSK